MFEKVLRSETAIVLAAHGSSKDVRINRPMFALAERIVACGEFGAVTPAFLDGQPSVKWVLDEIQQPSVVVIPFMTSCGYYTDVVFPGHLNSPGKRVRFAEPIGLHRDLPDLVHKNIQNTIAGLQTGQSSCIIVVGHGTRRNKKSCLTTIGLVKNLRERISNQNIRFAFIDQRPYLQHVINRTTESNLIVVPFLMGLGPHTTCDVPEAFGAGDLTQQILQHQSEFPRTWQSELGGLTRNVFFERPVGTYEAWGDICIELANDVIHMEVAA